MSSFSSAFQGASGMWFKTKIENGRKHLLVSESHGGLDNRSGSGTIRDSKGHVYEHNTSFPAMCNKSLRSLFEALF